MNGSADNNASAARNRVGRRIVRVIESDHAFSGDSQSVDRTWTDDFDAPGALPVLLDFDISLFSRREAV